MAKPGTPHPSTYLGELAGRTIVSMSVDLDALEMTLTLDDGSTLYIADPTGDQGLILSRD